MPSPRIAIPGTIPAPLAQGVQNLRDALGITVEHTPEAMADAEKAAANPRTVGEDLTSIEFITIDPASSMDLDQAMHIERAGDGYVVHYAIANVAAWVEPGSALDDETHHRGCTYYAPSNNAPLHPLVLAHGVASLLADGNPRPAYVWRMELDARGNVTATTLVRAMVKNTAKLTYEGCQADLDAGSAHPIIVLLKEVGLLREQLEIERGGISLPIPEQEIDSHDDGSWSLRYRTPLPIEGWNAQISLMTGAEAARMMIAAKVGVLRTLPPADAASVARLRRTAKALHIDWPVEMGYPDFVRTLDPTQSSHKAMLNQCTQLFRGAGYMSFNGALPAEDHKHNALAMHYAHTTAPLRRLVDRYVLEICACISGAEPIPAWCTDALDALPLEMEACGKREKKFERGLVDLVEALVLSNRVGETFHAMVLEVDSGRGTGIVLLDDPAVEAPARGRLPFGGEVKVKLASVDVELGKVLFDAGGKGGKDQRYRGNKGRNNGGDGRFGRDGELPGTPRGGNQGTAGGQGNQNQRNDEGNGGGKPRRTKGNDESGNGGGLHQLGQELGRGVAQARQGAKKVWRGAQEVTRGFQQGRRQDNGKGRSNRNDNNDGTGLPGKPFGR